MRIPIQRCGWLALLLVAASPLAAVGGSDEDPRMAPHLQLPAEGAPRAALPTGGAGVQPVYFVPQDSDATGTVLFLTNTNAEQVTVPIQGFNELGVLGYSLVVTIPAKGFIRVVSDSVVAAPPPSWADTPTVTRVVVANFTDFIFYARILLPTGVKVDGYVEWNPGTGTIDPRAAAARVPLRFSVGDDAP